MRSHVLYLLGLCCAGCAGHGAGKALDVHGASPVVWRSVNAVVRSYAMEHNLRFRPPGSVSGFKAYDLDPPGPAYTTLEVHRDFDAVRVEIMEVGLAHPSGRERDIQRDLEARLKTAGLRFSRSTSRTVVTN